MQNRQQILDFARQMLREKRYDEARKLLHALPKDDQTAQQWLAQIDEREHAESAASEALSDGSLEKLRHQGRSLGELLRGSFRRPPGPAPKAKPPEKRKPEPREESRNGISQREASQRDTSRRDTSQRRHPLAAPPEPKTPEPPPAPSRHAAPDAIFIPEDPAEEGEKVHPDEVPVGAILARSLVLAGVIIGIVLIILLFMGG